MENYISSTTLQNYVTHIKTIYDTTNNHGMVGLSNSSVALGTSDPVAVKALQDDVQAFYNNHDGEIRDYITGLHDAICPDFSATLGGVLKDYADKIILQKVPAGTLANSQNALEVYRLLEAFFAQIINYQTKALIVASEFDNYHDSSGKASAAYLDGTYKTYLEDEVKQFQLTVNYLMLNMIDYRTKDNFQADTAYINKQGLARDDVYLQVFARSRFFCAQLLNSFETTGFTLHGAVITPHDYSPGTQTPVTTLTLQFDGPNNLRFTKTVTASPMKGRFPYTKWNQGTSSPDNLWSFYDFNDFDQDLPAGVYSVTLVDNGNQNAPWYHTTTDLGQVSVKYYNPADFDPDTATLTPTPDNTVKFGAFSGRWNWGYCRLASSQMSQWVVPSKTTTRNKDNPELFGSGTYYPHKKASGPINTLGIAVPNTYYKGTHYSEYSINVPIKVAGAPEDGKTKASANIYYSTGGYVKLDNPCDAEAYARYHLVNSKTKKSSAISTQSVSNWQHVADYTGAYVTVDTPLTDKLGVTNETIEPNQEYEFNVDAELSFMAGEYFFSYGYITAQLDLSWYMQVVYTNTYNIFQ